MVDDLTRRIHEKLRALRAGAEATRSLLSDPRRGAEPPLDRGLGEVTTSSIDAYKHYAEGINLHERSREKEAAALFEKAIGIDPLFAMAYVKLAVTHHNMGNFAERDKHSALALKHADRLTPPERYYIEGFHYSNRADSIARSMDSYRKCIELDPGHQSCRHNLALQLLTFERFDEAIAHYEELVRRGSTSPTAFENLSTGYLARGDLDRGLRTVDMFVKRNPESGTGHRALGFALLIAGRFQEALESYTRAALLDPTDSTSAAVKVIAQTLAEGFDDAQATAQTLATSSEPTRKWFGNQFLTLLSLYRGRSGDALVVAERAMTAYRTPGMRSAVARRNQALILAARSQQALALAQAQRGLTESRNTLQEPLLLVALADVLARMGRRADAEAAVAELNSKADPLAGSRDTRRVHLTRGLVALASRDIAGAITALEAAETTLPPRGTAPGWNPHVPIWYGLGEAYVAAGRDRDAARSFQRVADAGYERFAFPMEYVRSFYFLGRIHERSGNIAKAREAYRRFVGYWKDGDLDRDRIVEAERKLTQLGAR
jgi:tetratricopeptide (TPR) repeat protein